MQDKSYEGTTQFEMVTLFKF